MSRRLQVQRPEGGLLRLVAMKVGFGVGTFGVPRLGDLNVELVKSLLWPSERDAAGLKRYAPTPGPCN